MTAPTAANAETSTSLARPLWARILLIVVALLESLGIVSAVFVLSGDLSEIPGSGFGGLIAAAALMLRPLLAIVALVFAVRGRLRSAIIALAAAVLMHWLDLLPSVVLHGLEFGGLGDLYSSAHFLISPVVALAAIVLAWRNSHRLGLAAILVSLPTVADWLSVVAFAIGIAIYGF